MAISIDTNMTVLASNMQSMSDNISLMSGNVRLMATSVESMAADVTTLKPMMNSMESLNQSIRLMTQTTGNMSNDMGNLNRSISPVSYTHLDVYKRQTSGWRPLNAPRQESPSSLGPPPPASRPDRQPSGWTQDQSPYPDLPGMPNHEAENWFNRHYGEGRR